MAKFKVERSKSDLRQLYATAESHAWVKARADESGAKMTDVVDALIAFTLSAEEEVTELCEAYDKLVTLAYDLNSGEDLPVEIEEDIARIDAKYGVPDDASDPL